MPDSAPARRRTLDPRLLVGIALVLISVAGVVLLVSAADRRTGVYAAAVPLTPGDRIDAGDLIEHGVSLDGREELYLRVGQLPEDGLVVTRPVAAGELVATSALGDAAGVASTAIVIRPAAPIADVVGPGTVVDIWTAVPAEDGGVSEPPRVLVSDAVVVRLGGDEGIVSTASAESVEVLVPRVRVARILQAVADEASLAVVPTGISWAGR